MKKRIEEALAEEKHNFQENYFWIEKHMPPSFFEKFSDDQVMTIVHNLMGFKVQGEFVQIHFQDCSIVICLNQKDADLKILKEYAFFGIQNYQTFVSDAPLAGYKSKDKIRIAIIDYTKITDEEEKGKTPLSNLDLEDIYDNLSQKLENFTKQNFYECINSISSRYLRVLTKDRLELTLQMYQRSKTRDYLQYEVRKIENWEKEHPKGPSMQIVLSWKNTHKYNFLFKLAKLIYRHNLVMKNVNATYIDPYSSNNILLMSLSLHGDENKCAWETTDLTDFLQELATLKYFEDGDLIESTFVTPQLLCGNQANLLRTLIDLTHQFALHADVNMYSKENITEAVLRHLDLTVQIVNSFKIKFHPVEHSLKAFNEEKKSLIGMINKIDTGNLSEDTRRKNVLLTLFSIIDYTLKTNFYRNNKSAIALRIDPSIFTTFFYDYTTKFPEIPYGIFFIKGKSYIGFQLRFKDLSRGGLRTIFPKKLEQANWERINVFSECYNLAYTQQKKNKDIPEGGSKAVIFIEPFNDLSFETEVYQKELILSNASEEEVEKKISSYHNNQREVYLYSSQRSYIYSMMTLINCKADGSIKAKDVVDYHGRAEYIYLGPDENMHNVMIDWIANFSVRSGYILGSAFISSKPVYGMNHKEYGVTSYGVNVYMHNILSYMNIDPEKDPFTIKISGGPDGDVAGNQMLNLYKYYKNTAKLLAITDVSGTIYDPKGLDLEEIASLFKREKPLRYYPKEKLNDGGLLLDMETKQQKSAYQTLTLCYKKVDGKLQEQWLQGNEAHRLYSHHLHQVKTDIFIPGGGRPRTLNINNYKDFLDPSGAPTSRAIVEGANLYLTTEARDALENLGVLIIKDSSANKGGVISSSLEVQASLLMTNEEFLEHKEELMKDVLNFIREKSQKEASLLLQSHSTFKIPLTSLSDEISKKINTYTYEILDYLEKIELSNDLSDPFNQQLVEYVLPIFRNRYKDRLLKNIPTAHKKAIIACAIAQKIVYSKGLSWNPSIVDVLPLIIRPIL